MAAAPGVPGAPPDALGGGPATPYAYAGLSDDLSELPPTCVENAEFDVLRASGDLFVEQLRAAGVDVESHVRTGVPHGHLDCIGLDAAAATMDVLAARLTASRA